MSVSLSLYGHMPDGRDVFCCRLENKSGLILKVIQYGCRMTELYVPDSNGKTADILWGYNTLEEYLTPRDSQGAIIGRYAGLIADSRFVLDGRTVLLVPNSGRHQLHGGTGTGACFSEKVWNICSYGSEKDCSFVRLSSDSPDGDGGFPGNLHTEVQYTITDSNDLRIDIETASDRKTVINLTSHGFFNLAGFDGPEVCSQKLMIDASEYTEEDSEGIPTGKTVPVSGIMDFRQERLIGSPCAQLPEGFNHNFVLDSPSIHKVCALYSDPASGRQMAVLTDQPGLQVYTAGRVAVGKTGKKNQPMIRQHAVCLETQHFPDSVHHDSFPCVILDADVKWSSSTIYRFSNNR